ncbi:MAG TPA: hypothetical protein VHO90_07325 [Bacteroidales bacterium]|nr:hypothetical protein [Bacteroidales bacterium]
MPLFKKKIEKNILEMVPFHVIKTFTENEGLITLHLPKFKKAFFSKWLIPKGKSETINIKFDKNGSLVWKHIDGKKEYPADLRCHQGFTCRGGSVEPGRTFCKIYYRII